MAKTGSVRRSPSDTPAELTEAAGRRRSARAAMPWNGPAIRDPATATRASRPQSSAHARPGRSGSSRATARPRPNRPTLRPAEAPRPPDHRIWVDLASPDEDQVKAAADALGLHPLIAEDIRERNQRSKIESFDEDVVHVVLFALHYSGEAAAEEIDFVLGKGYLLTVHDGSLGDFDRGAAPVRGRARADRRARTTCSTRSPTRSSTATSRSSTSSATTSTGSRTG